MATLVLVRHGRSTANVSGILTGRQRGVHLDDTGREQAAATAERLSVVPLASIVSSPLERCKETANTIAKAQTRRPPPAVVTERGLVEADYGVWQGRPIKELTREKLWKQVQRQPSSVTFPEGEELAGMSARAVAAVRRHDSRITAEHGERAVWVAVSHGDVIKAILADALGLHLDQFQRLHVDPASVSVVHYATDSSMVLQTNSHAGDLSWLATPSGKKAAPRAPVIGGGAGPSATS
jgi:probable phosphomutase (TIGR03848 family)